MKEIGFVISGKENERRRALLPDDISNIKNRRSLYFEEGYGKVIGYSDDEYLKAGVNIERKEFVYQHEIICNPKTPEPDERNYFTEGQTLFGWIHAVQGKSITDFLVDKGMTAIAWEDMYENGLHSFWENNEIAGEATILHCFNFLGRLPQECVAAIIGRGNCGRGAFRILSKLGCKVIVYGRETVNRLRGEIGKYDLIVNAVLWDIFRSDHLIYKKDLRKMKLGSIIVDISCDPEMGVETSRATTIENPVYEVSGILHYGVDHTPAIFYKSASKSISKVVCEYIDDLVEERPNAILEQATIIKNGQIIDERITRFQKRK